ncbi:histidinol dehydrogenase [Sediminicola luteus]|uniref:Histidinol dehydrogenase n=1 Tax=Sediminicola luteus TaxID=319238 RepID=A0A2A4G4Q9_9FLAO|nr:histidinol dehydrogenase [Sediminicola luteus]PCE63949.1 histidinol dehydrogenase [Sediminicola luteus]
MRIIENPNRAQWKEILQRPTATYEAIEPLAQRIFNSVAAEGDAALKAYTEVYDKVVLETLTVSSPEVHVAIAELDPDLKEAIKLAKTNIESFHRAQLTDRVSVETAPGVHCWQEKRAIEKVGLYIPGGSAPLFSTILMLAVPAQIAGCNEVILCTPPDAEGKIHPAILYTAHLCGLEKIYKVGGIQAIAAMTFGTETVPQVYKIFGPGNQYVTVAKQLATRFGLAIDMPAGPSELLVLADDTANAAYVASDLLSQAEHGPDSQVLLVSNSKAMIEQVNTEVSRQLLDLPRKDIAEKAIANSKLILLEDAQESLDLINQYGPEHFIICVKDLDFYIDGLQNAGSVFIGNHTPESAGDYASGTNHTLPTNGYAKQYSGVNLGSFQKSITFQQITPHGLAQIGPAIEKMAEAEGLQAHKNAVCLRLKDIK